MRIWFDLCNSPHVVMLGPMIRDLERRGHQVTVTSRPLANTSHLLELYGIRSTVVGGHHGASRLKKALGYPGRAWGLFRHLHGAGVDVAVSQSSFYSPPVARLLGARAVYMNDNEYALGNIPAFVCADLILIPECLDPAKLRRQLAARFKVRAYPGVKEGTYLWAMAERIQAAARARSPRGRASVYVRPEPWTAQYYTGRKNFLDEVLLFVRGHADVTVLARGDVQGQHYRDPRFIGIRVVDTALDVEHIAAECDLFIGAGGTMTREMAVLGIPTVSVYQGQLLDVDRFLLAQGAFSCEPALTGARVLQLLDQLQRRSPNVELLQKGRAAYDMITSSIIQG